VGGNIGNALSAAADHAKAGTLFVTELSSFQLEGIQEFRPHVAVMLNLSPNHLDRHPSLEAYAQAKRQIFRNQCAQDFAILNADDPWVAGLESAVASRAVMFSRRRELPDGIFVSRGKVFYRVHHLERLMFETRDVSLRGDFNLEDVLAATAAACMLGADFAAIRKAVREFQAVEHRLEFVRDIAGVDFYNNSKATSVDATAKSLEAFDRGVHLIMGGKDKGAPYTPLLPLIKDRVRDILLIGAAAPVIAQQLAGSSELVHAGDLAIAVHEAFVRSRPGDTVLLAPACSSFDQFADYEERGRVFKELVKLLAEEVAAGRVSRQKPAVPVAQKPPTAPAVAVEVPGEELKSVAEARLKESPVDEFHPGRAPAETERIAKDDRTPSPEPPRLMEAPTVHLLPQGGEGGEFKSFNERATQEIEPATPVPTAAERSERSYIYEIGAVELPPAELEPQEWPESEPSIPGSKVEPVADGPLPFEARPEKAAVPASQTAGEKGVNGSGREDKADQAPADPPAKVQTKLPGLD
jgi:UDP-N-acetylmuramoylalanine--D-glutamate ligase